MAMDYEDFPYGWACVGILVLLAIGLHFIFDLTWIKSAFIGLLIACAFTGSIARSAQLEDIRQRLPR